MNEDGLMQKLSKLIEGLGWDYDRMISSGQETYTEICSILAQRTQ